MRSIQKGPPPMAGDGEEIRFARYQDAAPHLMRAIGRYCSYCERTVPASLAVEHKLPKQVFPELACLWHNLLLACTNCNSSKGTGFVHGLTPAWPDEDDTVVMFVYERNGRIAIDPGLDKTEQARAAALLNLVGLDRSPRELAQTDHRFFDRLEVWRKAEQSEFDLRNNPSPELRRALIETARASGGYSIWRTAFRDDGEMRRALRHAFPGTRATDEDSRPSSST